MNIQHDVTQHPLVDPAERARETCKRRVLWRTRIVVYVLVADYQVPRIGPLNVASRHLIPVSADSIRWSR